METMTTLSVINLLPSTKESIELFVYKIVNEVKNGNVNALEILAQLKKFEKASDQISTQIKENALTEHAKYSEKQVALYGCKIERGENGTKYDYSACGDPEWNELDEEIKKLSEKKKSREAFLKNVSKPMAFTDEHTGGETVLINPPIKTSVTGLKFSI